MRIDSSGLGQSLHRLTDTARADSSGVYLRLSPLARSQSSAEVIVSDEAKQKLLSNSAQIYSDCFKPREGFNSDTLALNVSLPQALSSSQGKEMPAVAEAARQKMDEVYAAMEESGEPFNVNSYGGQDVFALFGSFDRRSLLAVAENESPLFTEQEQNLASSIMHQQRSLASGQYSGPLEGYSRFDHVKDIVESRRLLANFLDNVSAEEKATSSWASVRQEAGLFAPQSKADSNATRLAKLLTMVS